MVGRTLDSLAAQTRRPDEVILVDNASTDSTPAVLREWAGRMCGEGWRVKVIREPRKGASRARQTGLEHTATAYVMFFDSDDVMERDHISLIARDFESDPCLDLTVWNVGYRLRPGAAESRRRILPGHPVENHMVQGLLCTAAYAVRTSLIRRAGGWNPAIGGWDDWELGLRLLLQEPGIKIDKKVRVHVTVQEESISGTGYLHRHGDWERTLDAAERTARGVADTKLRRRLLRLIAYRRVNLAAQYRLEGRPDISRALYESVMADRTLGIRTRVLLRLAYLHTSHGLPAAGGIYPPLFGK